MKCIDPDETATYETDGVKFELGVLPKDVHSKVMAAPGRAMNYLDLWLVVKHGVKGHSNFVVTKRDGSTYDLPFETEAEAGPGKRLVVSERVMQHYHAARALDELALEILQPGKAKAIREAAAQVATLRAEAAASKLAETTV